MPYHQLIRDFWLSYVPKRHWALYKLMLLLWVFAAVFTLINAVFYHYDGVWYFPAAGLKLVPIFLFFNLLSLYAITHGTRLAQFTWMYSLYFLAGASTGALGDSIQLTPFPLIDHWLIHIDQHLHFNNIQFLQWGHASQFIHSLLSFCYYSVPVQLMLLPILFALTRHEKRFVTVVLALMLAHFMGSLIYYFFPTVGPSHYFNSNYFLPIQTNIYQLFYALHHHLRMVGDVGGLVAFPSYHVIWISILLYATRDLGYWTYILGVVNLLAVAATVFLGWHYLVDLIAGGLVASTAIVLAKTLQGKRYTWPALDCLREQTANA